MAKTTAATTGDIAPDKVEKKKPEPKKPEVSVTETPTVLDAEKVTPVNDEPAQMGQTSAVKEAPMTHAVVLPKDQQAPRIKFLVNPDGSKREVK